MSKFFDVPAMLKQAGDEVERYDDVLAGLDFVQGIDEIAFMFPDIHHANCFVNEAVQVPGVSLFNSATDHVHTQPLRTCYDVAYMFLTVPDRYVGRDNVRIEAMYLGDGLSPLHHAVLSEMYLNESRCAVVHASFKVTDEEDYAAANHRLRERGWEPVQRCESKYGRFGYWQPLDPDVPPGLYLKPRVNLRDLISPIN